MHRCEFDGRVTVSALRGSFVIYVRANIKPEGIHSSLFHAILRPVFPLGLLTVHCPSGIPGGGRFLQVASSTRPEGPFGPLQLIQIEGYDICRAVRSNIYSANLQPNPVDNTTIVGAFHVKSLAWLEVADIYSQLRHCRMFHPRPHRAR